MFPFCDSSSNPPMDLPFYQQLQLSPPSPKPDHQSTTSFLYYPCSPPFADAGLHLLPYHQQQIIDESPEPPLMEPAPAQQQVAAELANAKAAAARKDRHSKICTAGGMRDRRMRLSKDVAHKFFALQDMLGYDKASKTVQWLLNASKSAIQEMMADDADSVEDGSSSSLSVVDAAKQQPLGNGGDQQQHAKPAAAEGNNKKPNKARKTGPKPARKAGNAHPHPVPDKETRAKARERARERTKEKHRMRWVKLASAIDVEAAAACSSVARDTTNNHLMKNHHHHPEERCSSSTLNNGGGRMQEITGASDVILGFNGGYVAAAGNYYCQQEQQWDLGGVVFQQNNHQRFY